MSRYLIKNISLLMVLQVINYILPLVTLPYLVRTLGTENYGMIVFSQTFIFYFLAITEYGFSISATRQVALLQKEPRKVSEIFFAVCFVKFMLTIMGFFIMTTIVINWLGSESNWIIYYISFLIVIANIANPCWLFQGLERMKYVAIANGSGKILSTMAIFVLVHNTSDYFKAALIQAGGFLVSTIIGLIILYNAKLITIELPRKSTIISQLRDGWAIFTTSLMTNIITNSGTFILGLYQGKDIVGIYVSMDKIIKAVAGLFLPITQALFPYVSRHFSYSHTAGKGAALQIFKYLIPFTVLVSVGLTLFADRIVLLLYGERLMGYSFIIKILAIWLFFSVLNNIIGIQYLMGSGRSREYSQSFVISGTLTICVLAYLIPQYSFSGVLTGTILGEITLTVLMLLIIARDEITMYGDFQRWVKDYILRGNR